MLQKIKPEWGDSYFETVTFETHGDKDSAQQLRSLGQGAFTGKDSSCHSHVTHYSNSISAPECNLLPNTVVRFAFCCHQGCFMLQASHYLPAAATAYN